MSSRQCALIGCRRDALGSRIRLVLRQHGTRQFSEHPRVEENRRIGVRSQARRDYHARGAARDDRIESDCRTVLSNPIRVSVDQLIFEGARRPLTMRRTYSSPDLELLLRSLWWCERHDKHRNGRAAQHAIRNQSRARRERVLNTLSTS